MIHNCPGIPEAAQLSERFLANASKEGVDFDDQALVLLSGYFGSGMARASLNFEVPEPGVLNALIHWDIPKGRPLTPDTASYRYLFLVDMTSIRKVVVKVDGMVQSTFLIPGQ